MIRSMNGKQIFFDPGIIWLFIYSIISIARDVNLLRSDTKDFLESRL